MTARSQTLRVPAAVPGIVLRLLIVALVAVGVLLLMPYALWQGIAIAVAVAAVFVPASLAAWAAAACLPFGLLVTEPSATRTALAVLLVHAIHVVASLTLVIPARSRVSLLVLGPSALRFAVVQLIAQPVAFGVPLLVGASGWATASWLAPAAAGSLTVGLAVALTALRRADAESRSLPSPAEPLGGANVRGPS